MANKADKALFSFIWNSTELNHIRLLRCKMNSVPHYWLFRQRTRVTHQCLSYFHN